MWLGMVFRKGWVKAAGFGKADRFDPDEPFWASVSRPESARGPGEHGSVSVGRSFKLGNQLLGHLV